MKGFNRSIAIVIGIADYSNNIPSLRTPIADAKQFANIVQREHGYDVHVYLNATRDELLCLLHHELPLQGLTENDRLLFYFAGHGIAEDGEDGPQGYLVPKDAQRDDPGGFLPMSVVHDSLIGLACRHALIILDCCFAGAIRWSSTRHLQPAGLRMYQERYDRYIRDPAWQVLTSAAYNQKALDTLSGFAIGKRGDGESYSPFARALFSGLVGERNGKYRADVDGVITATSLYSYLRNTLEPELLKQGHRQTPGLWPLRKHDLGEFVFLKPGHKGELEFAPKLTKDTNPYLALASYEEDDRHLFFGRDKSIQELRDKVLAQLLTVVVGASGIGKSSLVKAGLVPALRESEEMNWEITAALRPGKSPVDTLRSLQLSPSETNEPVLWLAERIKKWRQTNLNTGLVIVIDQFEELITQCTNEESRQEFVRQLEEAVESRAEYLRLVLTIRSDFEPHFSGTAFKREWKHSRFIVLPMSQDELRKAIEGPARERVLFFKPDTLVDTLINDVLHTPSALPLLSYTLSELYRSYLKRQGMNRELLLEDYEALGGVAGTLRNRANEEYEKLSEPERETMRRVMLRMVSYEGSVIARRRVPRTELDYADEKENKRVDLVLDRLSEARLVVRSKEDEKAVVEPAHDVLILGWDKLSNWVSREEEGLSGGQRRRLREDAERWYTQVKAIALLGNRNDYLSLAISQRNQEPFSFNGVESAFISASEERQRVLNRRVWASVTLTIVVAISLAVLFWVLSQLADNRAQIAESRRLASQSQIESQSRLTLGNLLAIEAITANNTAEAESSLLTALQRQPALLTQHSLHRKSASQMMVQSVAVSPNGRWVGSVGADRTLVLLDLANKRQVKQIPLELDGSADALAFHPENKIAVISGIGGLLVSVDLESGQQKQLSASGLNIVEDLAFSPDGKWLVACGQDPQIIIWNWQNDPATAIPFNNTEEETNHIRVNALRLAFSPDGRSLAVAGSDGNIRLYSLAERKQIQLFAHDPNGLPIRAIAFNGPAQLASIGSLGDLRFWDVGTGQQQLGKLAGRPNQEAFSLAFSDDEQLLAIGTDAPSIEVWHLYSGRLLHELSYHSKSISKVAFRPRSKQLVSGGYDGLVGIWELSTFQTLATPLWAGEPFLGTAGFTPDGQYLVAASSDRLMIWKNIDSLQKKVPAQEPLKSKEMNFRTLGFSADKPVVAAGGEEYLFVCDLSNNKSSDIDVNKDRGQVVAIQLYDAARRAQIVRRSGYWQEWDLENQQLIQEQKFTGSDNVIFASIRSSDGALAWQTDKNLRFSRRAADRTFSPGEVIENASDIARVEFSPNGQYLGWSRDDGTVSWLRVEDQSGAVRRVRVEGRYPVLRFNHSGSLLAVGYSLAKTTGYGSGNVTFFNVETSQQLGVPLSNIIFNSVGSKIEDVIRSISFTPDDKWLVSYSDRAGPVLWDISREGWLERSRMLADRNFTCDEWLQFFGTDFTYHKTITDLPFADNMDQCPLPNVNKYRYLLPAVLVIWILLALLIVPWNPPRELLSHGLTSIILMLFVLGAVIVLWSAPQLEIEKSLPIPGAQVLRLFIFSIITVVCAWAQWYLDLEWRKFRSRNLLANVHSHRNS
jgi:WD40 repeat protein